MSVEKLLDNRQYSTRQEDRARKTYSCDICQEPTVNHALRLCKGCLEDGERDTKNFN